MLSFTICPSDSMPNWASCLLCCDNIKDWCDRRSVNYGVPKAKKKENISLPTFYMVIHFLYCISINILKFLVDYLHAIHIFILHYMVIHFLYCISINIFKFLADYLHAIHIFILYILYIFIAYNGICITSAFLYYMQVLLHVLLVYF